MFEPHRLLLQRNTGRLDYDTKDPLLDSSCFEPSDWVRIATDIGRAYHFYDGFVVCMGTDTMAYTASAVSFMLENLGKTVSLRSKSNRSMHIYDER